LRGEENKQQGPTGAKSKFGDQPGPMPGVGRVAPTNPMPTDPKLAKELRAAEEALKAAWALQGNQRKQAIRKLQIRYHPDQQIGGSEADKELYEQISQMANEYANLLRDKTASKYM
jgi:hypothetical protein